MKSSCNLYNIDRRLIKKDLATIHFSHSSATQLFFASHHFVQTITMNPDWISRPEDTNISFHLAKTKCFNIYERFGVSKEKITLRYRRMFISFMSNRYRL